MSIDDEVEQLADLWSRPPVKPNWHSFQTDFQKFSTPDDAKAAPCRVCGEPWDGHTGFGNLEFCGHCGGDLGVKPKVE